jgi:hypothetical protein
MYRRGRICTFYKGLSYDNRNQLYVVVERNCCNVGSNKIHRKVYINSTISSGYSTSVSSVIM